MTVMLSGEPSAANGRAVEVPGGIDRPVPPKPAERTPAKRQARGAAAVGGSYVHPSLRKQAESAAAGGEGEGAAASGPELSTPKPAKAAKQPKPNPASACPPTPPRTSVAVL